MENIDDLMRQKFDSDDPGQRFEFQEEFWEQAQALLEQEENRRRRRLWLWIALVLGIGLLVLLLSWCWDSRVLSQQEQEHKLLTSERIEKAGTKEEAAAGLSKSNLPASPSVSGDTVAAGQTMEKKVFSNTAKATNRYIKDSATAQNDHSNSSKTIHATAQAKSEKTPLPAPNNTPKSGFEVNPSLEPTQNLNLNPVETAPTSTQEAAQSSSVPPMANSKLSIFFLPIVPVLLPIPEHVPKAPGVNNEPNTPFAQQPTKPVADKRWSFGLAVAGSANQQRDTTGRRLGWTLGAYTAYQLNPNWSLMLGVQNRYLPAQGTLADSNNQNVTEQLRYSFGYRLETWKRETRGLYLLEIPLSVHWNQGAWGLEGGAAAGMLWYVSERTESRVETSLEGAKTERRSFLNGSKTGYNQRYYTAFAGVSCQLNKRVAIMTRGQYRFTPVFETTADGATNKGLGSLELGLRVKLF